MAFEELALMPELIRAVDDLGWTLPTAAQAEAIPLILGGGDVMLTAETGSGKTGAFALPILQVVHETLRERPRRAAAAAAPAAIKAEPPEAGAEAIDVDPPAAAAAAAVKTEPPPPIALSATDRDALLALLDGGARCRADHDRAWLGARADAAVLRGRVCYEVTVARAEQARVGWSTRAGTLKLGLDKHGFAYGASAKSSTNNKFEDYGRKYGAGDVVTCLLDADAGRVSFMLNGDKLGPAFDLPPHAKGQALYPALCLKSAEVSVNFGATPLQYVPPEGYVALEAAPADAVIRADSDGGGGDGADGAEGGGGGGGGPLCLILSPSRDLAQQTHNVIEKYAEYLSHPKVRSALIVGGLDIKQQSDALQAGASIVVGTAGRVLDMVQRGRLHVDKIRFFVLDEADRALDHIGDIDKVWRALPHNAAAGGRGGGAGPSGSGAGGARTAAPRPQVLMASATLHAPAVADMAARYCPHALRVDHTGRGAVPDAVDHVTVDVDPRADASWWLEAEPKTFTDGVHAPDNIGSAAAAEGAGGGAATEGAGSAAPPPPPPAPSTPEALSEGVKRLKQRMLKRLIDAFEMDQAIIFVRTNFDCDNVEQFLNALDGETEPRAFARRRGAAPALPTRYSCAVLAALRPMHERRAALDAFKKGEVRLLVATDAAARGIDVEGLPFVVNFALPDRPEEYVHRIGRVGRAECPGLAISLVARAPEKVWYRLAHAKGPAPWLSPTALNVRTNEEGGETRWFEDRALLGAIQARIRRRIPSLSADLTLPPEMAARAGRYGRRGGAGAGGGEAEAAAAAEAEAAAAAALEAVARAAKAVAEAEAKAQACFLSLKRKRELGRVAG